MDGRQSQIHLMKTNNTINITADVVFTFCLQIMNEVIGTKILKNNGILMEIVCKFVTQAAFLSENLLIKLL